uniref:Uncharacterized protein n=2 Tax=Heterosigma akashiwo TaxID=2829 RepID=A0A7S3Y4Z9_HETAK
MINRYPGKKSGSHNLPMLPQVNDQRRMYWAVASSLEPSWDEETVAALVGLSLCPENVAVQPAEYIANTIRDKKENDEKEDGSGNGAGGGSLPFLSAPTEGHVRVTLLRPAVGGGRRQLGGVDNVAALEVSGPRDLARVLARNGA